jgi:hypothetical protein
MSDPGEHSTSHEALKEASNQPQHNLLDREAGPKRYSGLSIFFSLTLLILVSLVAYAIFGGSPRVPLSVLASTASNDKGEPYQQEGQIKEQSSFSANATSLKANRNVTTAKTTSRSNGACVFDRSIAIFNFSDELLMQRVGLAIYEGLRDKQRFEKVLYIPKGQRLPDGEPLPELFMTLGLPSWNESGLPVSRHYEGELAVTISDQLRRSNSSRINHLTPPRIQFSARMRIEYSAQQNGLETSAARYQTVSKDLSKNIVADTIKLLDELVAENGSASQLPSDFYPAYLSVPSFGFLETIQADKLLDGCQLMSPCQAVWVTSEASTPQSITDAVKQSLSESGWTVDDSKPDYLYATLDDQEVEVFRDNSSQPREPSEASKPAAMFIVYRRPMNTEQIQSAVESMFQSGAHEDSLVMFHSHWHAHPEQVEAYFAKHSPKRAESWLQLAQFRKQSAPESAKDALLKANALRLLFSQSSPDSAMKKLAEELKMPALPSQISSDVLESLSVHKLDDQSELRVDVQEESTTPIWIGDDGKEQTWLLLTPLQSRDKGHLLRVQVVKFHQGGHSRSTQEIQCKADSALPVFTDFVGGDGSVVVHYEPGDGTKSSQLVVRRAKK